MTQPHPDTNEPGPTPARPAWILPITVVLALVITMVILHLTGIVG